jgi:hypothetical protein
VIGNPMTGARVAADLYDDLVASVPIRSAPERGDLCASTSAAVCHRIR